MRVGGGRGGGGRVEGWGGWGGDASSNHKRWAAAGTRPPQPPLTPLVGYGLPLRCWNSEALSSKTCFGGSNHFSEAEEAVTNNAGPPLHHVELFTLRQLLRFELQKRGLPRPSSWSEVLQEEHEEALAHFVATPSTHGSGSCFACIRVPRDRPKPQQAQAASRGEQTKQNPQAMFVAQSLFCYK